MNEKGLVTREFKIIELISSKPGHYFSPSLCAELGVSHRTLAHSFKRLKDDFGVKISYATNIRDGYRIDDWGAFEKHTNDLSRRLNQLKSYIDQEEEIMDN